MFSLQASPASNQLRQAGVSSEIVDVLMNMLGNCQQTLVHRGPITVSAEMPDATYDVDTLGDTVDLAAPDTSTGDSYPPAAASFVGGGTYNNTINNISGGGFAAAFHGHAWFGGMLFFNNNATFGPFIFNNGATGIDATVDVMSDLRVNSGGDGFEWEKRTLTFTKGILTAVATLTDGTIAGEECP